MCQIYAIISDGVTLDIRDICHEIYGGISITLENENIIIRSVSGIL